MNLAMMKTALELAHLAADDVQVEPAQKTLFPAQQDRLAQEVVALTKSLEFKLSQKGVRLKPGLGSGSCSPD